MSTLVWDERDDQDRRRMDLTCRRLKTVTVTVKVTLTVMITVTEMIAVTVATMVALVRVVPLQ